MDWMFLESIVGWGGEKGEITRNHPGFTKHKSSQNDLLSQAERFSRPVAMWCATAIAYVDVSRAFCKDFDVILGDKMENCGLASNRVRWISRQSAV